MADRDLGPDPVLVTGRLRVHRIRGGARAGSRRLRGAGARRAGPRVANLDGLDVERIVGDIRDPLVLDRAVEGVSTVFHLAAVYRFWAADPELFYDVNIGGTLNVDPRDGAGGLPAARLHEHRRHHRYRPRRAPRRRRTRSSSSSTSSGTTSARSTWPSTRCCARAPAGSPSCSCTRRSRSGEGDSAPTPTGRTILEFLNGRIPAYVDTALNVVHVDDVARGHVLAAQRGAPGRSYVLGGENMSLQRDARDARRHLRASGTARAPLGAGGAADRADRGMVPGDGAAARADAAVGAGPHGDHTHGVRRQPRPCRSSATRASPHGRRCARAAKWYVDNGFVKGPRMPSASAASGRLDQVIDLRTASRRARSEPRATASHDRSTCARCSRRAGSEAFALHERYVNPQMPRVLRTIGFDADYVRAEGAYLFDRDGRRYLDFLSGFGVFALGRCHPGIEQALRDAMDLSLPNLVQMECSPLSGLLAEALVARMPNDDYRCFFTNSGAESVETVIKYVRCATGRSRILFADHAFHGLTTGALALNGAREFRDRFGELLPGCESVPFGDLDALERELAGRRRRRVRRRADPGQGRVRRARRLSPRAAADLCHRHGALLASTRCRPGSGAPARSSRSSSGMSSPTSSPSRRRSRAATCPSAR